MNTWNAFLMFVFLVYIAVELYFCGKDRNNKEDDQDGNRKD